MNKKSPSLLQGKLLAEMDQLIHGPNNHPTYFQLGLPLINLLEELKSESLFEIYDIYFELYCLFVERYLAGLRYPTTYLAITFIHYRDHKTRLAHGWSDSDLYNPNH